jgi:hypothetical protein
MLQRNVPACSVLITIADWIVSHVQTTDVTCILSRVGVWTCVIYKAGSGLDNWINWHLVHTTRDYRQYSAIVVLHTSQITVTQALGFTVIPNCILQRNYDSLSLQITHEVFFAPPNSLSCHYSTAANSEDSTQFNSSAPKLKLRQAGVSKLDSSLHFMSVLYYDRRSVGQFVLVSSPHLGLMTRFFHCQTIAGFMLLNSSL